MKPGGPLAGGNPGLSFLGGVKQRMLLDFPRPKACRGSSRLRLPSKLFNSSLDGNVRRAIDFHEGDEIDEDAFKTLIRAAAALNRSSAR